MRSDLLSMRPLHITDPLIVHASLHSELMINGRALQWFKVG